MNTTRKITLLAAAFAALTLGATHTASAAVTISDAGFETPSQGTGFYGAFSYGATGSPWTFSGGSGLAGNGSGFTSGNPNAPEGTQVAFLQSNGSFTQTLTGFDSSKSYSFGFDAAQRQNYGTASTFSVYLDSTLIGTYTPGATAFQYQPFSTAYIGSLSGSHNLTFAGDIPFGDNTSFVDNITITAVPEPSQALAFAFGALALGGLMLRGRKRAAA